MLRFAIAATAACSATATITTEWVNGVPPMKAPVQKALREEKAAASAANKKLVQALCAGLKPSDAVGGKRTKR